MGKATQLKLLALIRERGNPTIRERERERERERQSYNLKLLFQISYAIKFKQEKYGYSFLLTRFEEILLQPTTCQLNRQSTWII